MQEQQQEQKKQQLQEGEQSFFEQNENTVSFASEENNGNDSNNGKFGTKEMMENMNKKIFSEASECFDDIDHNMELVSVDIEEEESSECTNIGHNHSEGEKCKRLTVKMTQKHFVVCKKDDKEYRAEKLISGTNSFSLYNKKEHTKDWIINQRILELNKQGRSFCLQNTLNQIDCQIENEK